MSVTAFFKKEIEELIWWRRTYRHGSLVFLVELQQLTEA